MLSLAANRSPIILNGWQADLAEEAGVGVRLHPTDHAVAAKELMRAFDDESWLSGVEDRARDFAEKRFDRDLQAAKLEELLLAVSGSAKDDHELD